MAKKTKKTKKPKKAAGRRINGTFTECGNPNGRPRGSKNKYSIKELQEAILKVEDQKNKPFLVHLVERAYKSDRVLVAVAKKILPDLRSVEGLVVGAFGGMTEEEAKLIQNKIRARFGESTCTHIQSNGEGGS